MTLFEIYQKDGFNKVYKLLKEVSIFEKRVETTLFIKYIGKDNFVILKKNKMPINVIDKILNPIYSQAEDHFKKIRFLKKFKNFIFKIGISNSGIRLYYVHDQVPVSDPQTLEEYAKLLKIKANEYLYYGEMSAKQKNEIISKYLDAPSSVSGVLSGSYYNFHGINKECIPNDMNVLIINDFMKFFATNDVAVKFSSTGYYERYLELMNTYIHYYLVFNLKSYDGIKFLTPDYNLDINSITHAGLRGLLEEDDNYIIIYKIIIQTFLKNIKPRGLYNESDITAIKETINKINLRLKGLDFINLVN